MFPDIAQFASLYISAVSANAHWHDWCLLFVYCFDLFAVVFFSAKTSQTTNDGCYHGYSAVIQFVQIRVYSMHCSDDKYVNRHINKQANE